MAVSHNTFGQRLRVYLALTRLLPPRSYLGKVLVLAFFGTHLPLIALVVYMLAIGRLPWSETLPVLVVAVGATILGSLVTLFGLWALLAPAAIASRAMRVYRTDGTLPALPTDIEDEGGRLLADVQNTVDEIDKDLRRLQERATRDRLTGLLNRHGAEERLVADLAGVAPGGPTMVLAALDIDGLKRINDASGHLAGDASLRHVAATLTRHLGPDDWAARWGGDEFIAVVWEGDGRPAAKVIFDRVTASLAQEPGDAANGGSVALGLSGGLARPRPGEDEVSLLARADAALYAAKALGGGTVVAAPEASEASTIHR